MSMSLKHDASERLEPHGTRELGESWMGHLSESAKTACPKVTIGRGEIPTTRIRSDVAPITPCHDSCTGDMKAKIVSSSQFGERKMHLRWSVPRHV